NEPPPAAIGHDLDACCAGIERVLNELLDCARRPLDHLAGGDAVDDGLGELTHGHGEGLIRNRASLATFPTACESQGDCLRYSATAFARSMISFGEAYILYNSAWIGSRVD